MPGRQPAHEFGATEHRDHQHAATNPPHALKPATGGAAYGVPAATACGTDGAAPTAVRPPGAPATGELRACCHPSATESGRRRAATTESRPGCSATAHSAGRFAAPIG